MDNNGGIIDEALHLGSEAFELGHEAIVGAGRAVTDVLHGAERVLGNGLEELKILGHAHTNLTEVEAVSADLREAIEKVEQAIVALVRHIATA
jgi:hypothetical protein